MQKPKFFFFWLHFQNFSYFFFFSSLFIFLFCFSRACNISVIFFFPVFPMYRERQGKREHHAQLLPCGGPPGNRDSRSFIIFRFGDKSRSIEGRVMIEISIFADPSGNTAPRAIRRFPRVAFSGVAAAEKLKVRVPWEGRAGKGDDRWRCLYLPRAVFPGFRSVYLLVFRFSLLPAPSRAHGREIGHDRRPFGRTLVFRSSSWFGQVCLVCFAWRSF